MGGKWGGNRKKRKTKKERERTKEKKKIGEKDIYTERERKR